MKYYSIIILACLFAVSCSDNHSQEKQKDEKQSKTPAYQLSVVEKGGVATSIKIPAQLAAYQEVSIFPKVNAYVKTVSVDIGAKVAKGTLLMVLEAPELEQAVIQAREKYVRSKAELAIDKERYNRLLEASQTEGAISPLDLSAIKAKMNADSAVCNAEKANWQMQQNMTSYLQVPAPFDGVITERNVHPGTLVSASVKDKPMLELKQVNHLRLQADVPEAVAATLRKGDAVVFYVGALQGKKMLGVISRMSMAVNTQYRSERIEIDVMNKEGLLSPGMYADLILSSKGNISAMYVPKSAIVTSTERKYVLAVRQGKTVKVDVSTGYSTMDKTEIYGAVQAGDKVISKADDEIPEGVEVTAAQ